MFIPDCVLILLLGFTSVVAEPVYQPLGQPAESLSAAPEANLTIFPSGENLPTGSGSVSEGEALFAAKCVQCHGSAGIGGSALALTGEVGSLLSNYPEKTVNSYWPYATTLFDYIRRAMPPSAPWSLTANETYALSAYLLSRDAIIDANVVLDEKTLPLVTMPNRSGFRPTERQN